MVQSTPGLIHGGIGSVINKRGLRIGIEGRMQYSPVTCTLVLVDATPAELIALHV